MTDTTPAGEPPLALDETARAAWNAIAPELRRSGLLTQAEEFPLARYCDYVSRWLKLRDKVNVDGETYLTVSKHGQLQRQNPDFKTMLDLESEMTALEDRFALTPLMRYKLKAIRANVEDKPNATLFQGANAAAAATPVETPEGTSSDNVGKSYVMPASPFNLLRTTGAPN